MEIKKWDHNVEEGIYKEAKHVKSYRQIKKDAEAIRDYIDENNGYFPEPYKTAYALSHCQLDIGKEPYHFFVVGYEFLLSNKEHRPKRDTIKNFYFPSQIIVNAEVLETPEKIDVKKPVRKLVKKDGQLKPTIELIEKQEKNKIGIAEACMSFLHRTPKTMERFYRIKVRYQYPLKVLGISFLVTKTEWVDGLKSHIFQHECDHAKGENMFYK
jgi:hypothetical protein